MFRGGQTKGTIFQHYTSFSDFKIIKNFGARGEI